MRAVIRYAAGYVLDFFRERVTAEDFRRERVERVLLTPGLNAASRVAARAMFPQAELRMLSRASLARVRSLRFDVAYISMGGGPTGERIVALLSGARHKLLVPSPEYVYRLGIGGGWLALAAAIVDRFVASPLALLWLGLSTVGLGGSGLLRRIVAAERLADGPERVLVIRLIPAQTLVGLLRRLRERWPGARLFVIHSSYEQETTIAAGADRVIRTAGLRPRALAERARRLRPEVVILAGGADYGMGPTYWKGVLLARLSGGRQRYQWELGDDLPGRPLGEAVRTTIRAGARRLWERHGERTLGFLARPWRRRVYQRPPSRGPRLVQIGITEACNYRCLMCPYHNPEVNCRHRESEQPRMSYELFARLLVRLRRMGTQAVDLCGNGEPLTHPEAMEMIALAREMGFTLTLATNAALLTKERARRLVELGLRRMHVSVNAGSDETYARTHPGTPPGTFSRIIGRLREMADYADETARRRIDVEFSAVLTRLNMHELDAMVEAAHAARANWFMLIQMGPVKGQPDLLPSPEEWPAIRRNIRQARALADRLGIKHNLAQLDATATAEGTRSIYETVPCYIGYEFALILGGGEVVFCCHCDRSLGDLNKEDFEQVWRSETYREARRRAMAMPLTKEALWDCGCFYACSHVWANLDVHRRLHGDRSLRAAP
jgi:MoaA/NifB/PqqE/SkfB family radical SAM enzyme